MGVHRRSARLRHRVRGGRRGGLLRGARRRARHSGLFGALLAPAALALLSTTFTDPDQRGKAFGVYSAISGGGAAVGLLLGGILTETLTWRWCLYVNLLFAIPAALAAIRLLVNEARHDRAPLDLPGTATASLGLFALVYGVSNSEMESWGHPVTIAMLTAAGVLLAAFVAIETHVAHPLLPMRVVRDRTRGGAYLGLGLAASGMYAAFLFLTYYMQRTKGFTPIESGLAFLPMTAAIVTTATAVNVRLLRRFGPRPLLSAGMAFGAAGMAGLAQLTTDSSYAGHVLPALLVTGVGLGAVFASTFSTATYGVQARDTGVASAMLNTMQQVGGSVGTAVLSSIFADAMASYAAGERPTPELLGAASVHGYTVAFWVASGIFAVGAVLVAALIRPVRVPAGEPRLEPAPGRA